MAGLVPRQHAAVREPPASLAGGPAEEQLRTPPMHACTWFLQRQPLAALRGTPDDSYIDDAGRHVHDATHGVIDTLLMPETLEIFG